MQLAKTDQMRAIEEAAIDEQGVALYELMERAGMAVAAQARDMLPKGGRIVIVCGKGNNGGDGYVAARLLSGRKYDVEVVMLSDPERLRGPAAQAFSLIATEETISKAPFGHRKKRWQADLLIDAIFGFGLKGPARAAAAKAIEAVNASKALVLAVDIPSGVDSDTGRTAGPAVEADRTVTFTAPKAGMAIFPGCELSGEIRVADIGIAPEIVSRHTNICLGSRPLVRPLLPERVRDAHKGDCGRVLVVAGSVGMTGAAALAANSAVKIGAGLVTLAVPESLNDILETKLTEVITKPLPETTERTSRAKAFDVLMEIIPDFDALVVGPGLSTHESTVTLVRQLVIGVEGPMIVDADALNALVGQTGLMKKRKGPTILTPHAGELGRLLGVPAAEIQADRLGAAQSASEQWGATVILKGARTVVAGGDCLYINPTGNPGMATAGTGDVLAGLLGGLVAQGLPPYPAAVLATYLHGGSGDLAADDLTELALTATDLIDYLPAAIKDLRAGRRDDKDGE